MHWLDVYRKIRAAGKRMMMVGGPKEFMEVAEVIGSDGFYCNYGLDARDTDMVKALLAIR